MIQKYKLILNKKTDWKEITGGSVYEIEHEITEDRPLIQVYKVEGDAAILANPTVVISKNIISLVMAEGIFDGYVVIK